MSGTLAASTPTNRRLAGITSATVNGTAISVTEFSWSPGNVKRSERTRPEARDGDKRSSDAGCALRARISHTQNAQLQRLADRLRAIDHVEFA